MCNATLFVILFFEKGKLNFITIIEIKGEQYCLIKLTSISNIMIFDTCFESMIMLRESQ
jgi:hypothetical protein